MRHVATAILMVWCAAALVGSGAAQQSGRPLFEPCQAPVAVAEASVPLGPDSLHPMGEAHIDSGLLMASVDGVAQMVPCTHPDGTGVVHALTREPSGRVVVTAEYGLFVLDGEHLCADRMDVEDGLPGGPAVGVAADEHGRIWLCTKNQFAVLDARFGFARTFAVSDLPPPPFTAVAWSQGHVHLRSGSRDWFRYQPDVGPAPQNREGQSHQNSVITSNLTTDVDGTVRIALDVVANGGATLRQRRRHHHRLYAIEDQTLTGMRPGNHTVEVHAVDRDLRRAVVARYRIRVPFPPQYSLRWLPVFAGVAGLLLFALAWPWRGRRRFWRTVLRTGMVSVVGLQILAAFLGYGRSWPFVGFSMYTENYFEGSVLYKPRVRGLRADGQTEDLNQWQLGLVQDGYWQMLAEWVHGPERQLKEHLKGINQRRRWQDRSWPPLVGIEIADTRMRLTADGPVEVAPTIVHRWVSP